MVHWSRYTRLVVVPPDCSVRFPELDPANDGLGGSRRCAHASYVLGGRVVERFGGAVLQGSRHKGRCHCKQAHGRSPASEKRTLRDHGIPVGANAVDSNPAGSVAGDAHGDVHGDATGSDVSDFRAGPSQPDTAPSASFLAKATAAMARAAARMVVMHKRYEPADPIEEDH